MFCIIDREGQRTIGSLDTTVGEQKIDSSVLRVVSQLFPEHTCGQLFFIQFLKRAARERSVIPHLEKNTVCISTKSIATLGHELGLSNDTTQKYVKLYIALGLLRKQKFLDQLAFVMVLGIYSPAETLEANLDALIAKSRSRLRDMAQDVKHRCQVYGLIEQGLTQKLTLLQMLLQPNGKVSKRTLEQRMAEAFYLTSTILPNTVAGNLPHTQARVDSSQYLPRGIVGKDAKTKDIVESTQGTNSVQNLLQQASQQDDLRLEYHRESPQLAELSRWDGVSLSSDLPVGNHLVDAKPPELRKADTESTLCQEQERLANTSTSVRPLALTHQVDSLETRHRDESIQRERLGRLGSTVTPLHSSESLVRVDSLETRHRDESTQRERLGRLGSTVTPLHSSESLVRVDSLETRHRDESTQRERLGRLGSTVTPLHSSESLVRVDSGPVLHNVYVNNIYQFLITSTLREPRRVAEFFAEQLEHDQRVYPKYQKLLFIAEGQPRDPHVLAAAFICTMVRLYRDRWNISDRPGGFFTKRCREYDTGVPAEVEQWIEWYGALSPSQLQETLTTPVPSSGMAVPAGSARNKEFPSKQPSAPLSSPPAFSLSVKADATRVLMDKEEAEGLVQIILRDNRTRLLRVCCVRLSKEQPRYAVLVDASIPGGPSHQTIVYSVQDWQGRLSSMKTWHDLIYPVSTFSMHDQRRREAL